MELPSWLHVGVFMYTSCNDEWWGPVIKIYEDDGEYTLDFEFDSHLLPEFIDYDDSLRRIVVPDGTFKLLDVKVEEVSEYEDAKFVILRTPGNGCRRCSKLFSVHEKKGEVT